MSQFINIALDGYSSTGKSTLAKELAESLGYRYVDTGAMYRGITLYALRNNLITDFEVSESLAEHLKKIKLEFVVNEEKNCSELYLNDENVEEAIREMEVARHVSNVAAISAVRRHLVKNQREMALQKRVVMDGRDIGTVVLPDAELKVFVTAREEVRVERRYQELLAKGKRVTKEEIRANLQQRDLVDTNREDSPLRRAEDACLLDNSDLSKGEQLVLVQKWVEEVVSGIT